MKPGHLLLLALLSSGCTAARLNSAIGKDKATLLENVGAPKQIVRLSDASEIWIYRQAGKVGGPEILIDDQDSPADVIGKGIAEGVADTMISQVVLEGCPCKYVYIGADGRVKSWESRTLR